MRLFAINLRGDASANGASAMIRSISRMAVTVMVARSVDVDVFGLYVAMVAVETIVISIISAICSAPIPLLIPGRSCKLANSVIAEAERMQLVTTAVVVVLAFFPVCLFFDSGKAEIVIFLAALIAHSMMSARRSSLTATFRSRCLLRSESLIGVLPALSVAAADIVAANHIVCYWVSSAIACLISVRFLARNGIDSKPTAGGRLIRRSILSRGAALALGSVASNLQSRAQPLILIGLIGASGAGQFGAVNMFAAPARMVSMCVRSIAIPRLTRRANADPSYRPIASRIVPLLGLTVALAAVSAPSYWCAPWMIRFLLGSGYVGVASALPIVLWCGSLMLLSTVLVCEMQAVGRLTSTATARWCSALASVAALYPLASVFGIPGACASVVVGELLMILFVHVDAVRWYRASDGIASRRAPARDVSWYPRSLHIASATPVGEFELVGQRSMR